MRKTNLFLLALFVAACGGPGTGATGAALPAKELEIGRVSGTLPVDAPGAPAWDQAREVAVTLLLQDVAEPRLTEKGVETLMLRALHDGSRASFWLTWKDDAAEDLVDIKRSTDCVAIQFPATGEDGPLPDSMMGEEGKPVSISLWRYSWQRRMEGAEWGIAALYPNAAIDHYPPEGAKDEGKRAELEKLYNPPDAVGNALAAAEPRSAVEDLLAEGFGTLKHAKAQRSIGKGVHADGSWSVVITRALDISPGSVGGLVPGKDTFLAVAVWDGAKNQSGSKKMRSVWVPVRFAAATP